MNSITKNTIAAIISALLMLLFTYTAINKLIAHERFRIVLSSSSITGYASTILSWLIPVSEFAVVFLLFFPGSRKAGLISSAVLLSIFTIYIVGMLLLSENLPCSCGGVISSLSWSQHLIFNVFFILLAFAGYLLNNDKRFIAINRKSRIPV